MEITSQYTINLVRAAKPPSKTIVRALANRYAAMLQLCSPPSTTAHHRAKIIHANMITTGFNPHGHIINRLIDIYCKCNNIGYARQVFDEMPQPDIVARTTMVSAFCNLRKLKDARRVFDEIPVGVRDVVCYNAMITGCNHNDDGVSGVELFVEMLRFGFKPDHYSYSGVVCSLGLIADDSRQCYQMHCAVEKSGSGVSTSVLNSLVSLYVKCASSPFVESSDLLGAARKLFDEKQVKDELTWTTMITGYARNDDVDSAREIFDSTREKDVAVWNAMISGYVHHGLYVEALELFRRMHVEGMEHDEYTYTNVLGACADSGMFSHGRQIHARILRKEATVKHRVEVQSSINNALVTLYSKCGRIHEARHIFEGMHVRDIISWNAILSGYVAAGMF